MFGIDDAIFGTIAGGLMSNLFAGDRQEDQQGFNQGQQYATMEYNSAEAAKNRTFQHQAMQDNYNFQHNQAQNQMSFQERMSSTANQRAIADLKAAGLNPMLSLMHNSASTPSGASGSGGAARGSQAAASAASSGIATPANEFNFPAAMQTSSNIDLQRAEIDKKAAETERERATTKEIEARTPTHAVAIEQMKQNITQSVEQVKKIMQETQTSAHSAANIQQQTVNLKETIPHIQESVKQLKALTTLNYAQAKTQGAVTNLTEGQYTHLQQVITQNLPSLQATSSNLQIQSQKLAIPAQEAGATASESYIGQMGAYLRAILPITSILNAGPNVTTINRRD